MPALTPEQVHQKLLAKFGPAAGPLMPANKDPFCTFAREQIVEICEFLRTDPELSFEFLQDLTATDHPKENLIRVVYHFYSYHHRHMFKAKAELPRDKPEISTVEGVWKAANWLEREVYDLFGVTFVGHSDLRRIMLPDDWVGTPLRKDYTEAGGYQGISNIRDNPLDQYLMMDRALKLEKAAQVSPPGPQAPAPVSPAPAGPVPAAVASVPAPAEPKKEG